MNIPIPKAEQNNLIVQGHFIKLKFTADIGEMEIVEIRKRGDSKCL